ncbi:hypothetical protein MTO96_023042, partial [Rhipicephalus appendiculatus]
HQSGDKIVKVTAHGKIFTTNIAGKTKSAMNVSTGQDPVKTYILRFWDKREHCGV